MNKAHADIRKDQRIEHRGLIINSDIRVNRHGAYTWINFSKHQCFRSNLFTDAPWTTDVTSASKDQTDL